MYKVVKIRNKKLISCVICDNSPWKNWWRVRYIPGQWVKAKKGKLFVCKTLEDAKKFYEIEKGHEIWRCEVKNIKLFHFLSKITKGTFKKFWNKDYISSDNKLYPRIPCYGADQIKLTKKVWPNAS